MRIFVVVFWSSKAIKKPLEFNGLSTVLQSQIPFFAIRERRLKNVHVRKCRKVWCKRKLNAIAIIVLQLFVETGILFKLQVKKKAKSQMQQQYCNWYHNTITSLYCACNCSINCFAKRAYSTIINKNVCCLTVCRYVL